MWLTWLKEECLGSTHHLPKTQTRFPITANRVKHHTVLGVGHDGQLQFIHHIPIEEGGGREGGRERS